jgi:hypothetical protein
MQKATTFEHGGKVYEVRAIPTLNGWKVRIFVEGIPANGFTYSVDSEVYQDAAIDGVPEDLVAGLMETAERDFRRGLAQELVAAEKATDDDIAAEIDKFKPWDRKPHQFSRLDFEVDKTTLDGQTALPKFILERRGDVSFSQERYYSAAPMHTAHHLEVLTEIEKLAARS